MTSSATQPKKRPKKLELLNLKYLHNTGKEWRLKAKDLLLLDLQLRGGRE